MITQLQADKALDILFGKDMRETNGFENSLDTSKNNKKRNINSCKYCRNGIDNTKDKFCDSCGAPNENYVGKVEPL
jgi:rubrerythrin